MKNEIIACTLGAFCLAGNSQAQKTKVPKPNIIFIITDDLGSGDLGIFYQNQRAKANKRNEPWAFTPNLDKMAAQGVKLNQHYCAAPVCAPSRASVLLGKSQGHANVRDNQFDKALEENYTLGSVMRAAGYRTAAIGKWGLQGKDDDAPNWSAHPLNRGFDYFYGYIRHVDGHEHYPKEGVYRNAKEVWENRTNVAAALDKCYTADLWTAAAKKWIVDHEKANAEEPFFMYLAYDTPHAVLELPTQQYPAGGGLKGGMQWLGKPGQMINTASGKVDSWIHPDYANATYDDDNNPSTAEVAWPNVYKRYATATRRIDDAVGDLRQLLKDLKIDENTLIVFTSDNGPSIESYLPEEYKPTFFKSNAQFDGIKRDCWEGGVRVPTLAAWPGHIPAGKVIDKPNATYDWLATFTNAAGLPAPAESDGVSLLPSLIGQGKQDSSLVYVEYFNEAKTPDFAIPQHQGRKRNQMQLIRVGDYVGVRYNILSANDDFEIYNVMNDPREENNLAGNPEMKALQQTMKDRVLQSRRPNNTAIRPYDDAQIAASLVNNVSPGMLWKVFDGSFPWVPQVNTLIATENGVCDGISNKITGAKGEVVYFSGYIRIPQDGDYTFCISAAGKALLRIHDATVIDADYGYFGGSDISGSIKLKAGLHPFRLYFMKNSQGKSNLEFKWSAAGLPMQLIPANAFFH